MSFGSRAAFFTWRLYRTSALARRFLDPVIRRSAEKGLARHDSFVEGVAPPDAWSTPRPVSGAPLVVGLPATPTLASQRLVALLGHWGARYSLGASHRGALARARRRGGRALGGRVVFGSPTDGNAETLLEQLGDHPVIRRTRKSGPLPVEIGRLSLSISERPFRRALLDPAMLAPSFVASPWGSVVADALDWALERTDWREPLPALVSARIDDVTGEKGLGWLRALEDQGVRPLDRDAPRPVARGARRRGARRGEPPWLLPSRRTRSTWTG